MIPPSYVRVLEAIMRLHREQRLTTSSAIEKETGYNHTHVVFAMMSLEKAGLISMRGTIVPRVRFIHVDQLTPKEK